MLSDTELLDSLEKMTKEGACPGIIFDDNGHWAVSFDGTQNVPGSYEAEYVFTTFEVEADKWRSSIREAISLAIEEWEENK